MIGDTLSDAVISLDEYLEADMCVEQMHDEIVKLRNEMNRVRERYDYASLTGLDPDDKIDNLADLT